MTDPMTLQERLRAFAPTDGSAMFMMEDGDGNALGKANALVNEAAAALKAAEEALAPFAEPHPMGDNYVKFAPRLIVNARAALAKLRGTTDG